MIVNTNLPYYYTIRLIQLSGAASAGMVVQVQEPRIECTGTGMIQCRLRELMAAKGRRDRRRITYDDIRAQTGLSKTTLTRLANDQVGGVSFSVMDRLCTYLECQPGDLFIQTEEPQNQ